MKFETIKCPNCGSSEITNKNICKHCGSKLIKQEEKEKFSKSLSLTISGMNHNIVIKKAKNNISTLNISGINQFEELTCESLNLKVSGMNNIIKVSKDIELTEKIISGMNNKIIIF